MALLNPVLMDHLQWKPFRTLAIWVFQHLHSQITRELSNGEPHDASMMVNAQMSLNTIFHLRRSAHLYLMKEMVAKLPLSRHWAVSKSSLCYCARWHAGWKCRLWYTRPFILPFIISALYWKAHAEDVCVRCCITQKGYRHVLFKRFTADSLWVYQACGFQGCKNNANAGCLYE